MAPTGDAGDRVADLGEEVEVTERVAGLALRHRAEQRGDVGVALDVGLLREVEVAAVRLALARERLLEVRRGSWCRSGRACVGLLVVSGWLLSKLGAGQASTGSLGEAVFADAAEHDLDRLDGELAAGSARARGGRRCRGARRGRCRTACTPGAGARARRWDRPGCCRCRRRAARPRPSPRGRGRSGTRSCARWWASRPGPPRRATPPSGACRRRAADGRSPGAAA